MKKLSFALAFALICISVFSCSEKSVISPLDGEFKITTFSPASGFTASEVTLFGENLTKDSIVAVSFGDQTAEILSRSTDSVTVRVPDIAVGIYDITVKTKTKSFVYDAKYEVLENDFKITSFFPLSNFAKSQITLYGKNFDKYSDLIIQIGDNTAEIISRTDDSLTIKIPNIESGMYDISINVKSKSFVYNTKFEILYRSLIDDLTQIKNVSFGVKNFKIKYDVSSYSGIYSGSKVLPAKDNVDSAFTKNYKNSIPLVAEQIGLTKFKIREIRYSPTYSKKDVAQFEVDFVNRKFSTLKLDSYLYNQFGASGGTVTEDTNFGLDLTDVGFEISENDSIILVKLYKPDITSKLNKMYYDFNQFYRSGSGHYSNYKTTFLELIGLRDDATIEIIFTK